MPIIILTILLGFTLSACTPIEQRSDLVSSAAGGTMTAGPGDTVMDLGLRPLMRRSSVSIGNDWLVSSRPDGSHCSPVVL